jgi:flagellar basal body rod protein FlgG
LWPILPLPVKEMACAGRQAKQDDHGEETMPSGKYGAISGAVGRMEMMNNISEHLAAAKTSGYKKGVTTFAAKLGEATSGMATKATNYTEIVKEEIDFTSGELEYSGDPLDLAINGEGFFQIQRPDGSLGYTRKGNFQLDGTGQLRDSNGYQVMGTGGPIRLQTQDVDILADGAIWAGDVQQGQLAVYQFEDTSVLERAGDEMFVASDGTEPQLHANPQLVQHNLEASNINMMREMVRMTTNMRAFEATQKALRIYSDMDSKASDIGLVQ